MTAPQNTMVAAPAQERQHPSSDGKLKANQHTVQFTVRIE